MTSSAGTSRPTSARRRALVVGAGISGLSAATALHSAGWDPVIVERSEARRRGGYFIAMYGCGRIAAERIGLKGIRNRMTTSGTYQVDRQGRRRAALGFQDLPGGPWMMLRGDVEQAAFEALPATVELRFDTSPTGLDQDADGATVTLYDSRNERSTTERFDLVVGADGLRSTVRKLAWGPDEDYLRPLGFMITAFELPEALPGLPSQDGAILSEPGRSFWVFPFADHPPTVLFSYQTDDVAAERARAKAVGWPAGSASSTDPSRPAT
ncbi:FAD-dependent monooxygenase [Microlunatus parietis]|uniref:2-polyprenyl-6-methoxyphenol hydroxylase-like FAD-dependent oxidoreductase n=1 Tax=Microlunatus parietis TaxID=682979 RepID=A0A7Y9IC68_9ACTN|nr:FAD-dependent monooxygenase [Microlunatus parietis]NYE74035.1 2-polyprenyl-6-methoxyphenol hydroxylase-like FAD-dependent oxidoreductase [Microlunatus parietis]